MIRTVIIGGGIIGLSLAYELSCRGQQVLVVDCEHAGRASWAGAGMLPPANLNTAIHPLEQLAAISNDVHAKWAKELKQKTGIDNGYSRCGGLYVARSPGEIAALAGAILHWQDHQIEFEKLTPARLTQLAPDHALCETAQAVFVPAESQFRNPRHLQALRAAAQANGVEFLISPTPAEIVLQDHNTQRVQVGSREVEADQYCVACGPWSEQVLMPFHRSLVKLPMTPVRGQIVLFKLPRTPFTPIINEGARYLVPRADGHVLAGSTIDEVGFDIRVDLSDTDDLRRWAASIMPSLNQQSFVRAWAGLRPGTYDGFPYLGLVGRSSNTFVATGHFKSGLQLSAGTAIVMADLIQGSTPPIDLSPFSPSRVS